MAKMINNYRVRGVGPRQRPQISPPLSSGESPACPPQNPVELCSITKVSAISSMHNEFTPKG